MAEESGGVWSKRRSGGGGTKTKRRPGCGPAETMRFGGGAACHPCNNGRVFRRRRRGLQVATARWICSGDATARAGPSVVQGSRACQGGNGGGTVHGTTTARVRAKRARAACARAPSATRPQRGVATAWRGKGGTGLVGSVLAAAMARPRYTGGGTRRRAKPKPGPWVRVHERDARCAWHGHNEADGHSG